MTDSKIIVRYSENFGRMGSLGSTFACTELELRALKAWGSYHHGEVLGKHSDITGTFNDKTLVVLTSDVDFVDKALEYGLVDDCPYASDIADALDNWPERISRLEVALSAEELRVIIAEWGITPPDDDDERGRDEDGNALT